MPSLRPADRSATSREPVNSTRQDPTPELNPPTTHAGLTHLESIATQPPRKC